MGVVRHSGSRGNRRLLFLVQADAGSGRRQHERFGWRQPKEGLRRHTGGRGESPQRQYSGLLHGLGAVLPIYTVTVKSRVDGQLMEVHYKEGDIVQKGDPLIEIDPRPYQVALTQAEGQLIRDQALLDNARIDLARYETLLTQNAIPEQQLATQEALVTQDEGTVKNDQGADRQRQAQRDVLPHHRAHHRTRRPAAGGSRQHRATTDTNGLLVITQIEPISVIFPLPRISFRWFCKS